MGLLLTKYTCPKCKKSYKEIPPLPKGKSYSDKDFFNRPECPDCKVPFKIGAWEAIKHIKIDND